MRQQLVVGNWKMNGRIDQVTELLEGLIKLVPKQSTADIVVLPPAIYIPLTQKILSESQLCWGAQNIYPKESGAYTGETSAPMLQDYACRYVLVGHSERRHIFHENEKFVAEKFHHVKDHDMIPLLCVGETLAEREHGVTEEVITRQLLAVANIGKHVFQGCVVAYEPVWAIGTGQTASPEQVQMIHSFIRTLISEFNGDDAVRVPILYGGSVTEKNSGSLFAMPDVDGGLIGGASLNARQFVEIVKCIKSY